MWATTTKMTGVVTMVPTAKILMTRRAPMRSASHPATGWITRNTVRAANDISETSSLSKPRTLTR